MKQKFFNLFKSNESQPAVDAALEDWRRAPRTEEALTDARRLRILHAARREAAQDEAPASAFASLFVPARRVALTAALPAVVLTLVLGYLAGPGGRQASMPGDGSPVKLQAEKRGNQVVFVIANGHRSHVVQRSIRPDGAGVAVESQGGAFRDRLDTGAELTFYRVD